MVYKFKPGHAVKGVSAQDVGDRLERIADMGGGDISPKAVVEDARPADSPLHPAFEWSNRRAADLYRISQAQNLIRSVVRCKDEDTDPEDAPAVIQAFVAIGTPQSTSSYTTTARALSDTDLRAVVLSREIAQLKGWRQRNAHLTELAGVFAAIDELDEVHV